MIIGIEYDMILRNIYNFVVFFINFLLDERIII